MPLTALPCSLTYSDCALTRQLILVFCPRASRPLRLGVVLFGLLSPPGLGIARSRRAGARRGPAQPRRARSLGRRRRRRAGQPAGQRCMPTWPPARDWPSGRPAPPLSSTPSASSCWPSTPRLPPRADRWPTRLTASINSPPQKSARASTSTRPGLLAGDVIFTEIRDLMSSAGDQIAAARQSCATPTSSSLRGPEAGTGRPRHGRRGDLADYRRWSSCRSRRRQRPDGVAPESGRVALKKPAETEAHRQLAEAPDRAGGRGT